MNLLTTTTFSVLFALNVTANGTNTDHTSSQKNHPQYAVAETKLSQRQADALLNRVYEIRAMDLKALNKTQKAELRKEVMSIKEQLDHPVGGVYISVGGLIIILLLLIILF